MKFGKAQAAAMASTRNPAIIEAKEAAPGAVLNPSPNMPPRTGVNTPAARAPDRMKLMRNSAAADRKSVMLPSPVEC